ncbi:MAG: hypothetical protein ACLUQK_07305 [Clostridium sp.]|uniref:hypothetical protein n=1 Tax=Clostridium innocuum TaxID=1522 RepID=UPI001E419D6F|nr:hypothetical protein [[Clostridium] innocuum]MCC2834372.1 hypothetical protein [[Clostridium] innocuum]MCR0259714.1 hypothetical protein [[Clostridium] innocuum]
MDIIWIVYCVPLSFLVRHVQAVHGVLCLRIHHAFAIICPYEFARNAHLCRDSGIIGNGRYTYENNT